MAALHDELRAFLVQAARQAQTQAGQSGSGVPLAPETAGAGRPGFVPGTRTLAGRTFHSLRWQDLELVVVLSGIGKVATATTATLLADRFGVEAMVFTGVAGGLGAALQVGDVVVADALLQHDMDASPLFARHEVPLTGLTRFASDPALSNPLYQAAHGMLSAASHGVAPAVLQRFGLAQPRVHRGLVVSGDRFVATAGERERLMAAVPDALAVEMEGAAVAQVCHAFGLPLAVVRTVSDRADDSAAVDFPAFTAEVASPYSACVLGAWLNGLGREGRV
ncbi:5'-methylthioadenosine/S-adenosylhomocysteine nucleosidase [Comamonas serinivorans]|uniref:adenosylhomocysteine nucleosidase n=2 Tax=Comamonas serinivorans TaxID=1082851 RepID=A0A1Y0ETL2_9BURK|nr:5'-methylthioadenosine/S-adenosylhomocysteine nucleosidase [Comamonas serinivorans]